MSVSSRVELRIPSHGDDLAAWLYRAEGGGRETACVVLMHGFTATRDEELDRFCERFAAAGCSALAFDLRHFGAGGGRPRRLLELRRQYEDCDAALAHARGLEGIDGSRVVVWGTSFAGGHALDAAARNPRVSAAICLVPLMDGAVPPPGRAARKMIWSVGAGLRDTVVVRNSSAEKAARSAPKGELRHYPGLDHFGVYTPPGFDAVIEDQLAFLRNHGLANR